MSRIRCAGSAASAPNDRGSLQRSSLNLLPLETVANRPLGSESSDIAAYGADSVLPTNFVPGHNRAC
jgi:hypothetical protein